MKKFILGLMIMSVTGLVFGQTSTLKNYQLKSDHVRLKATNFSSNNAKGTGTANADFENWNSDLSAYGLGEMPNGFIQIDGAVANHKSTTAQNGTYSIHLESNMAMYSALGDTESTLYGGMAFIGGLAGTSLGQGEPYTSHLTSIDGFVRGSLLSNDTALVIVETFNGGTSTLVASGMMMFGPADLSTTWIPFTVDMVYEDGAPAPDSINMFLTSSGVGIFNGFDIGTLTAGSWVEFDNFTYNVEIPTTPVAGIAPASWAAGSVNLTENATSGTFTLTNNGTGTLTVSDATVLSAPWSTTFDASAVSLGAGEQYTFTFNFAPTVAGPSNTSFEITSNGGNVAISLSGSGFGGCDAITAFPYSYGFEDADFGCWELQYNTAADGGINGANLITPPTTNTWFLCTAASFSGDGATYINSGSQSAALGYTAPDFNWLISPEIQLPATEKALNFMLWYFQDNDYSTNFYVNIFNGTTWTPALTYTTGQPTNEFAEVVTVDLSSYANSTIKIAFVYEYTDGYQLAVDDVTIDNISSVNTNVMSKISVYPNPASDVVTVKNAENANIVIVNMVGSVVANVENASANQTIDISNLANGTYFVRVNAEVFKFNVVK